MYTTTNTSDQDRHDRLPQHDSKPADGNGSLTIPNGSSNFNGFSSTSTTHNSSGFCNSTGLNQSNGPEDGPSVNTNDSNNLNANQQLQERFSSHQRANTVTHTNSIPESLSRTVNRKKLSSSSAIITSEVQQSQGGAAPTNQAYSQQHFTSNLQNFNRKTSLPSTSHSRRGGPNPSAGILTPQQDPHACQSRRKPVARKDRENQKRVPSNNNVVVNGEDNQTDSAHCDVSHTKVGGTTRLIPSFAARRSESKSNNILRARRKTTSSRPTKKSSSMKKANGKAGFSSAGSKHRPSGLQYSPSESYARSRGPSFASMSRPNTPTNHGATGKVQATSSSERVQKNQPTGIAAAQSTFRTEEQPVGSSKSRTQSRPTRSSRGRTNGTTVAVPNEVKTSTQVITLNLNSDSGSSDADLAAYCETPIFEESTSQLLVNDNGSEGVNRVVQVTNAETESIHLGPNTAEAYASTKRVGIKFETREDTIRENSRKSESEKQTVEPTIHNLVFLKTQGQRLAGNSGEETAAHDVHRASGDNSADSNFNRRFDPTCYIQCCVPNTNFNDAGAESNLSPESYLISGSEESDSIGPPVYTGFGQDSSNTWEIATESPCELSNMLIQTEIRTAEGEGQGEVSYPDAENYVAPFEPDETEIQNRDVLEQRTSGSAVIYVPQVSVEGGGFQGEEDVEPRPNAPTPTEAPTEIPVNDADKMEVEMGDHDGTGDCSAAAAFNGEVDPDGTLLQQKNQEISTLEQEISLLRNDNNYLSTVVNALEMQNSNTLSFGRQLMDQIWQMSNAQGYREGMTSTAKDAYEKGTEEGYMQGKQEGIQETTTRVTQEVMDQCNQDFHRLRDEEKRWNMDREKLMQEVSKLKAEKDRLVRENGQLKTKCEEFGHKYEELDRKFIEGETEKRELRKKYDDLKKKVKETKAENGKIKAHCQEATVVNDRLKNENTQIKTENTQTKAENAQLRNDVKAVETSCLRIKDENSKTAKFLRDCDVKLVEKAAAQERFFNRREATCSAKEANAIAKEANLTALQHRLASQQQDLLNHDAKQLKESEEQRKKGEEQRKKGEEQRKTDEEQRKKGEEQRKTDEEQRKKGEEQRKTDEEQLRRERILIKASRDLSEHKREIEQTKEETNSILNAAKQIREEYESKLKVVDDLFESQNKAQLEINKAQNENRRIRHELNSLKDDLEKRRDELDKRSLDLDGTETALGICRTQLIDHENQLKSQANDAEEKKKLAEDSIMKSNESLAKRNAELDKKEADLDKKEADVKRLVEKSSDDVRKAQRTLRQESVTRAELARTNREQEKRAEDLTRLEKDLIDLKAEIDREKAEVLRISRSNVWSSNSPSRRKRPRVNSSRGPAVTRTATSNCSSNLNSQPGSGTPNLPSEVDPDSNLNARTGTRSRSPFTPITNFNARSKLNFMTPAVGSSGNAAEERESNQRSLPREAAPSSVILNPENLTNGNASRTRVRPAPIGINHLRDTEVSRRRRESRSRNMSGNTNDISRSRSTRRINKAFRSSTSSHTSRPQTGSGPMSSSRRTNLNLNSDLTVAGTRMPLVASEKTKSKKFVVTPRNSRRAPLDPNTPTTRTQTDVNNPGPGGLRNRQGVQRPGPGADQTQLFHLQSLAADLQTENARQNSQAREEHRRLSRWHMDLSRRELGLGTSRVPGDAGVQKNAEQARLGREIDEVLDETARATNRERNEAVEQTNRMVAETNAAIAERDRAVARANEIRVQINEARNERDRARRDRDAAICQTNSIRRETEAALQETDSMPRENADATNMPGEVDGARQSLV